MAVKTQSDSQMILFLIFSTNILTGCHGNEVHSLNAGMLPACINYSGHSGTSTEWSIYTARFPNIQLEIVSARLGPSDCSGSYLEIRDGSIFSHRIAKICRTTPTVYKSTGRYMTIIYHAEIGYGTDHFKVKYSVNDDSTCQGGYKTATSETRSINIPSYSNYQYNAMSTDCEWLLDSGDTRHVVSLDITSSTLRKPTSSCSSYYMEAFDGFDASFRSLRRWCGSNEPTITSTGRYMYIQFHSERINSQIRFKLAYSSVSVGIKSTSVGVIAGGIVAGLVGLVIIVSCVVYYRRKTRTKHPTRNPRPIQSTPTTNVNVNIYAIAIHNRSRNNSTASNSSSSSSSLSLSPTREQPPAYEVVVKNDTDLPPSYTEAVEQQVSVDTSNQTARFISSQTTEDSSCDRHISARTEENSSNQNPQSTSHSMYI